MNLARVQVMGHRALLVPKNAFGGYLDLFKTKGTHRVNLGSLNPLNAIEPSKSILIASVPYRILRENSWQNAKVYSGCSRTRINDTASWVNMATFGNSETLTISKKIISGGSHRVDTELTTSF